MKKILFVFMFLASTFAFGQSLQIMYQGKALAAGDTIDIAVTSPYAETELYFDVVNLTEDTLIAWAARENISLVSGSDNYFCFGNCFDSATDTCVYGLDLNPKDTLKNEFSAHYTPKGNAGTSLIKYSVYVEDKLSDLTAVYVRFNAVTGVKNNSMSEVSLNAYPNPASDNVTIAYQLPQGNMAPAYLVVKNLIGKTVMTVPMPQASEKMMINVSELTAGVYFYSIEQNSRALMTKKMIVK